MPSLSKRTRLVAVVVLVALLGFTAVQASDRWLHVRVEENDGTQVNVNIPLAVVERMLPLISADELHGGKLDVDLDELEEFDLAEIAAALGDAPDADYVTVKGRDESVRVAKENGFILVDVSDNRSTNAETVHVRMPMEVFDAMVSDSSGRLDLVAAIQALGRTQGEDLVRVESRDGWVRVWVDDDAQGR